MGSCLQFIFPSSLSFIKRDNLINSKELNSMIKPSTSNDSLFYSSENLSKIEAYLNQFKANDEINQQFMKQNICILNRFTQSMKDRTSPFARQLQTDQQRIQTFLKQQRINNQTSEIEIKVSNLIVLRIELQTLLVSASFSEINDRNSWDLIVEIQEDQCSNYKIQSLSKQQIKQKTKLIRKIIVNNQNSTNHRYTDEDLNYREIEFGKFSNVNNHQKINILSQKQKKQDKKNTENHKLIKFPIFVLSSKIVQRDSKINLNLYKVKKLIQTKTKTNKITPTKPNIDIDESYKNIREMQHKLLGSASLSASDFIFYNTLLVSDVVPIRSPIHSRYSISTASNSSSKQKSCIVAYISLRGQGLLGQSLEKDYTRIIKQHEAIILQLQTCMEGGEKMWEKLVELKQSGGSQKDRESHYSQYSVHPQNGIKYNV